MELISGMMLRSGVDLELTPKVSVHHPKVSDVLNINHGFLCEDYYWTYVFTLMSDPYDNMVYLDDNHIDYETVSSFDVFSLKWKDARKDYIAHQEDYRKLGGSPLSVFEDSLAFFFGPRRFYLGRVGDNCVIADEDDPEWLVGKDGFELAVQFITKLNCIVRDDKIKPATKSAKRVLIEDKRLEEKRQASRLNKKEDKTERIADAMAAVDAGVGMVSSYDDLPMYRLLSTARNVQKRIVVQSMYNGIYTGMLKSDGLSDKDLRWAQA